MTVEFIIPRVSVWPSESFDTTEPDGLEAAIKFLGKHVTEIEPPIDNLYRTGTGQQIVVHPPEQCAGETRPCVIHRPSDHHMRTWITHWRSSRGIMERLCEHGIGHPDPDEINPDRLHGCDGCCAAPSPWPPPAKGTHEYDLFNDGTITRLAHGSNRSRAIMSEAGFAYDWSTS